MLFIDKMHFYCKKIDNGKVTQAESEKNELPFRFINTHSTKSFRTPNFGYSALFPIFSHQSGPR